MEDFVMYGNVHGFILNLPFIPSFSYRRTGRYLSTDSSCAIVEIVLNAIHITSQDIYLDSSIFVITIEATPL
jgi:hypothetical protein